MEIKQFAPVLIPTLNRYEHFRRCLESLERCTWADKTDVYVALDYPPSEKYVEGWKINDAYLKEKEKNHGFKSLTVVRRETNHFMQGKTYAGILEMATKDIDYYISSEDDNEFAPAFLDFMNKALEKYKDNPKVKSVTSYTAIGLENVPHDTYFTYTTCAWGFGRWRSKPLGCSKGLEHYKSILADTGKSLRILFNAPAILSMLISMAVRNADWGDVSYSADNILEGNMQLRPKYPLVINHGFDGSGLHSGDSSALEEAFAKRGLFTGSTYNVDDIPLKVPHQVITHSIFTGNDLGRFDLKTPIITLIRYIRYRLSSR